MGEYYLDAFVEQYIDRKQFIWIVLFETQRCSPGQAIYTTSYNGGNILREIFVSAKSETLGVMIQNKFSIWGFFSSHYK